MLSDYKLMVAKRFVVKVGIEFCIFIHFSSLFRHIFLDFNLLKPLKKIFLGGIGTVRLCNGSRMHFESCSLSLNGTSLSRGQIPFVLYSIQDDESGVIQQLANPEQVFVTFHFFSKSHCCLKKI